MRSQLTELRYAVRIRIVLRYLGQLMLIMAGLALAPLAVSLGSGDTATGLRYAIACTGTAILGGLLARFRIRTSLQANEGIVITASAFLIASLVMVYPWMAEGVGFGDAIFEAISAITTTGLTTLSMEDRSFAFLFARAWGQWFGGLGFVILSLALIVEPGPGARGMAAAEAETHDLVAGLRVHARRVLVIYGALTGVAFLLLWSLRMGPSTALLHALTAVSTGGFAPNDDSLAGFGWPLQAAVIMACILGAFPLMFYYHVFGKRPWQPFHALQPWTLCLSGLLVTLLFGLFLGLSGGSLHSILRNAPLVGFSAQTGSGFTTMDLSRLDAAAKLALVPAMLTGGGVGSTTGGFKLLRLLILLRLFRLILAKASLSRHAVVSMRIEGRPLEDRQIHEALLIIVLFIAVVFISWLPFVAMGYDPSDSLFEVVSATGTVGLSVGVTASDLPALLKGILCMDMLLGRLEIMAWMVALYPGTWFGRKMEDS